MGLQRVRHDCVIKNHLTYLSPFPIFVLCAQSLTHVRLFAIPLAVARQAPLSIEFSRQEYQSGQPFSSPGDFSNPGTELRSPTLQADSLPSEPPGKFQFHGQSFNYSFALIFNSLAPFLLVSNSLVKPQPWLKLKPPPMIMPVTTQLKEKPQTC